MMQDDKGERPGQRSAHRPLRATGTDTGTLWSSPARWPALILSTVGSALALSAVGAFCALLYPILRELRAERVTMEDGTEVRMLGVCSVLVISVMAGFISCCFSWTLVFLDSYEPGMPPPTPLDLVRLGAPGRSLHVGHGVAVLNGVMAALAVSWGLA